MKQEKRKEETERKRREDEWREEGRLTWEMKKKEEDQMKPLPIPSIDSSFCVSTIQLPVLSLIVSITLLLVLLDSITLFEFIYFYRNFTVRN